MNYSYCMHFTTMAKVVQITSSDGKQPPPVELVQSEWVDIWTHFKYNTAESKSDCGAITKTSRRLTQKLLVKLLNNFTLL